ncbi:EscU/YscU/HrcU family type III secretion system export apparatus switch protein [Paracoccus cavernae]|uniref:EscU/YscU/HrcU family type III secretion system export apparatus switch protein n=1 Tax=Paracoccus cavernae TaxID=1571207 RepID=UPI00363DFA9E
MTKAARLLGDEPWPEQAGQDVLDQGRAIFLHATLATCAAIALMGLCVLLGQIAQRSFTFTPKKVAFDFKRLNPIKNAGQKFWKSGLVNFAISLGKVALVSVGGVLLFRSLMAMLLNANFMADWQWVEGMTLILQRTIYLALGVSVVFAGVDLFWKHLDYRKRNRMSRKEMVDEHKHSEGDPHFKAARRQRGVDMIMNRMLDDVQKADVVIVNPTHYAVALQWKRGSGVAPVCLAKGWTRSRDASASARPNTTSRFGRTHRRRALHATVKIGEEINVDHFAAVAAAIRYSEHVRRKVREGWGNAPPPKGRKKP